MQMVTTNRRHQTSPKLLSDTKQTGEENKNVLFTVNRVVFFRQSLTSTKSNWVRIILCKANIICPALKNQQGQSSEMCANSISCAPGELNETLMEMVRGGRGCARDVFLEGLQFRGRSRWTADNQTAAVINSL